MASQNPRLYVLLTRPNGENDGLASMLRSKSCQVTTRPMIEVSQIDLSAGMKQVLLNFDDHDKVIFVSKSSVRFGLPLLDAYWPQWPPSMEWFAVGPGTASALGQFQIQASFPDVAGSEGLLRLAELKSVSGQNVLIVRGQGGRELLADQLKERGARLSYLEVYHRTNVEHDDIDLLPANTTVVLTSVGILDSFCHQVGKRVSEFIAVVPSGRIAEIALARDFSRVKNAAGASDQALYDSILLDKL